MSSKPDQKNPPGRVKSLSDRNDLTSIKKHIARSLAGDLHIKEGLLELGWMPPSELVENETLMGTTWRHVKTGGIYRIVGQCWLEATRKPAILYYSAEVRMVWARDKAEFMDGRFERIEEKKRDWFSRLIGPRS